MRDWMAEALALPEAYAPAPEAPKRMDKKDNNDRSQSFVLNVHSVHLVPSIGEAEATPLENGSGFRNHEPDTAVIAPPPSPFAPGEVGEWQRGLARLRFDEPPCPGFRHWPSVHKAAMEFLHERGEEAAALGWGVLDLFGVHHVVGTIRGDCCGALLGLAGRPVVEMTSHLLRFSDGLAYRRRPMLAVITIPIWEFKR